MIGYLAQRSVQAALGVPLNYTDVMESVNQVFSKAGDNVRRGYVEDMGFLLDSGVKVAMVYGDRDYVSFPSRISHIAWLRSCRPVIGWVARM